jgi:thioredoxin
MSNETSARQIVKCPHCGANNRVAADTEKQAVCGRCKNFLPTLSAQPLIVTDANFDEIVGKSSQLILLDFWAAWCGPCRIIAPIIDSLAKDFAGKATIGKLNVDENPRTATQFGVQSIPTLLVLKNGHEVDRIIGAQPKEAIARKLQQYL